MKLHKKTLKWCAKLMEQASKGCFEMAKPRGYFDCNVLASRDECLARGFIFARMAKDIRRGGK